MKGLITCSFGEVHYLKGKLQDKHFRDELVSVEGKMMFLGATGNWCIKLSKVIKVDMQDSSVRLETDEACVELHGPLDERSWQAMARKLERLLSNKSTADFLTRSNQKSLGNSRKLQKKPPAKRFAFGSKQPLPSRVLSTTVSTRDWSPDATFSDDENEEKQVNHVTPALAAPESIRTVDVEADIADLDSEADDGVQQPRKRSRLHHLKRTAVYDDTDDDDGIFDTPHAHQPLVTPGGTLKKDELDFPHSGKKQPMISSYFICANENAQLSPSGKKDMQEVDDCASALQSPGTPVRATTGAPTLSSVSASRLVRSSKRKLQHDSTWLHGSRAGFSPLKKSAEKLFGTPTWTNNDPIEEFDDNVDVNTLPPRKILPRKRPHHFFPRTTGIHSPLHLSKTPSADRFSLSRFSQQPSSNWSASREPALASPPVVRPCRGLRNLGNTCYLNASLQMLYTVPHLLASAGTSGGGGELTQAVARVRAELEDRSSTAAVNPRTIKEIVDRKTDKFVGYEQRDAHEFLSDLIDYIQEEVPNSTDQAMAKAGKDMKSDPFCCTLRVCLKCESCGYSRTKDEIYRHLSIDIVHGSEMGEGARGATTQAGLARFFEPEMREIKCEKCETGSHAMQTLTIVNSPKALLLHFKRFIIVEQPVVTPINKENASPNSPSRAQPVEYVFKKNKAPVVITDKLSLDAFRAVGAPPAMTADYSVQSIVYHHGSRAHSGHYTADGMRMLKKEPTEQEPTPKGLEPAWVIFDDGFTARTSWNSIASSMNKKQTAYMLLYTLSESRNEISLA